jgi:seryl-tRNA synthetase
MLDRGFIRDHPDRVRDAVRVKGVDLDVDELLALDESVRRRQHQLNESNARRKAIAKAFGELASRTGLADAAARESLRGEGAALDERAGAMRTQLAGERTRLDALLLTVPAIPWDGAPVGADDTANVVVRRWGEPPRFGFAPLDHVELAQRRGWAEFERARVAAGERAYALRGDLVLLERAVHSYALDLLRDQGFTPIAVPSIVREEALVGTGMFPKGREETYELAADGMFLAGTAEVAMVGLHSGEILDHLELPLRYAGIAPCFRREIGSAGRDVRGFFRVHQFEKVEQFVICVADDEESARWHALLLTNAERILQDFGLPYEVVECSTGDMGLGKVRMNDINTWLPSLGRYRETHSCSTLHDWQARRASIRYRDETGTVRYAHTLNNTGVATPRLLAALLENHQTADARVRVPDVLVPYLAGRRDL